MATSDDLTRSQLRARIEELEARLASREASGIGELNDVLNAIQDGISVLDRDLVITQVNAVMERWYAANLPLVGKKCHECYHDAQEPCDPCPTLRALESGETESDVVPGLPGSEVEWVELYSFPIRDPRDGSITGVVEFVRDITNRVRAEQERQALEARIQQAQKMESLGVLAGGIAHDFNNLLVGLLGNAELALFDLPPESLARPLIEDISTSAKRASELTRQMLAYAGKAEARVEAIDLRVVVEEMLHLVEAIISKKASLRLEVAPDTPRIQADATQLRQVLMNFITNASDALGDESGIISVRTGSMQCDRAYLRNSYLNDDLPAGQYAFFEVSDTGHGMTPEVKQRIFEPFYSTKFSGRGLGLAAALGIVRSHAGAINVYSEPGRGTTIKVLLPVESAVAAQPEAQTDGVDLDGGGRRVLLVDDEDVVRTVGERMLQRLGFDVDLAVDGQDAIDQFEKSPGRYACVILDLTMPRMDGEECLRTLRRIDPQVRILLTSGYNEQDLIDRFVGRGLAAFMQKPFLLRTLEAKLREVIAD